MPKFQKVHRDANHLSIVKDLRKHGYHVIDLAAVGHSVPDIVVADADTTALIEIKTPEGWFHLGQLEFLARWPGVAGFAERLADCIALLRRPESHRLSRLDKEVILEIVQDLRSDTTRDQKQPRIMVKKFERLWKAQLEVKL